MTTQKIICEIEVTADTKSEAEGHIMQMMSDYFKHYCDDTKVEELKVIKK